MAGDERFILEWIERGGVGAACIDPNARFRGVRREEIFGGPFFEVSQYSEMGCSSSARGLRMMTVS